MVICLRTKTDFLHIDLNLFGFLFLLTFLQLVKEFRVIDNTTNRGLCVGRNLYKVRFVFFGQFQSLRYRIHFAFYFIAYYADFFGTDLLINPMLPF